MEHTDIPHNDPERREDFRGHHHRGHGRPHHHRGPFGRPPMEAGEADDRPHRGPHGRGSHDEHHGGPHGRHGHHRGPFGPDRHRGRLFDYGELRLLLLALIAERPRHGYELIKEIEERFGGVYSPSPGVIYPTLSWLDDMGYSAVEPVAGGRKQHRITAEGEAFLTANRAAADALLTRLGAEGRDDPRHGAEPVIQALRALKGALRSRLREGTLDEARAQLLVEALEAARTILD